MSAAGSIVGTPDPGAVLALFRLLTHVMGERAPAAPIVAAWKAYDRALVRRWAERSLARKIAGADGCPPLQVPRVLAPIPLAKKTKRIEDPTLPEAR